jgi:membrane-bound lytic murein transglycosylase D
MEITSTIDERYNVLKSTDAACAYLKSAYEKFGSWTAAAASYNCGMGGYQNAVNFQGTTNYYDLILPEETQRYIFRVLAFKYLLSNASTLGYQLTEEERYTSLPRKNDMIPYRLR